MRERVGGQGQYQQSNLTEGKGGKNYTPHHTNFDARVFVVCVCAYFVCVHVYTFYVESSFFKDK